MLLDEGVDLHADVLKVPHHGAATSLPEFFEAVDATVAVVSVGENTYGHPVPATLDAIAETGAQIWRRLKPLCWDAGPTSKHSIGNETSLIHRKPRLARI